MASTTTTIPKYLAISEHLRKQILEGKLLPGTRLPSQAKFAEDYGVSLLTARQALGTLETEGLIRQHHGRGTFVARSRPTEQRSAANSIGLLFVDNTTASKNSAYCMGLIREISDALALREYDLKVATVDDSSLTRHQPHLMLDPSRVRAVVMDGTVSQFHVDFVRHLGLDVLVAGNHPVREDVPQVRYDVRQAAHQLALRMMSLDRGPLILWTEPFRFHYTTEILLGYQQAAFDMKRSPMVYSSLPTAVETWDQIIRSIVAQYGDRFCLMSMFRNTQGLLRRCAELSLDAQRIPTCLIGGGAPDDLETMPWVVRCDMHPGPLAKTIVQRILEALEQERTVQGAIFEPVIRLSAQGKNSDRLGERIHCEWSVRPSGKK